MSGRAARGVVTRLHIEGTLILETPANLGSGDSVGLTDIPLLLDPLSNERPLLTGTSIAGALRSYLREFEHGYGHPGSPNDLANSLFGRVQKETSYQSWLLVDDALGETPGIELRDGVAIDARTRTAAEDKKYDVSLLEAGTTFPLSLELLLTKDEAGKRRLLEALAIALRGLQAGEIGLGLRKRRGLGRCRVEQWRVRRYDLRSAEGLMGWLDDDHSVEATGADITQLLAVSPPRRDARHEFVIEATFNLESSLLIRSGSGEANSPDMVHLRSRRRNGLRPVLSGTSLAGAVRGRALRIANTMLGREAGADLVNRMFGQRIEGRGDEPTGSRVVTQEVELSGTQDWVQSRVKIDRFTGGAYPQALFTQQPAFGGNGATVPVHVTLRNPTEAEMGLLLLVLKDLWSGDLPLGGESSVGRGRLQGQQATLTQRRSGQTKTWVLVQADGRIEITGTGTREELEGFVRAFNQLGEAP